MNGNKGFTLIELMVVIIILGILAALAIPRYMGARNSARAQEAVYQIGVLAQDIKSAIQEGRTVTTLADIGYTLVAGYWDPAGESHFDYTYVPAADPATGGTITARLKAGAPAGWPAAATTVTLNITTNPDTWGGTFPGRPTGQLS